MIQASFYAMVRSMGFKQYPPRYKIKTKVHYPTPGCMAHNHPRQKILFAHYCLRNWPQSAIINRLYWRLHPEEFKELDYTVTYTRK